MNVTANPHIRGEHSIKKAMGYVILALLPAAIYGIYIFGVNAFYAIVSSIIAAVITEAIIQKLRKKPVTINDGSAVLTGLLVSLVIPPTVPFWLPMVGSFFAIAIAKQAFGGLGFNIFNPALSARAFLMASWPVLMTAWIKPFDSVTSATPLGALKHEGSSALIAEFGSKAAMYTQLFIGNVGGSIGETSALLILAGGLFLILTKIIDYKIPLTFIGTVFVVSFLFGQDPTFSILAGGVFLGAFFMATDYVTSPITKNGRLIFAFGCGLLTVIIRLYSGMPEGVCYAILLMNAATPIIDRLTLPKPFGYKKKEKVKEEKKEVKKDEIKKEETKKENSPEDKKTETAEKKRELKNE